MRHTKALAVIAGVLASATFIGGAAHAGDVYKYVDERGTTLYTDKPIPGAVLLFTAAKLATSRWIEISPAASIGIIALCIGATIWPSVRALRRVRRELRHRDPALAM